MKKSLKKLVEEMELGEYNYASMVDIIQIEVASTSENDLNL